MSVQELFHSSGISTQPCAVRRSFMGHFQGDWNALCRVPTLAPSSTGIIKPIPAACCQAPMVQVEAVRSEKTWKPNRAHLQQHGHKNNHTNKNNHVERAVGSVTLPVASFSSLQTNCSVLSLLTGCCCGSDCISIALCGKQFCGLLWQEDCLIQLGTLLKKENLIKQKTNFNEMKSSL